MANYTSMPYKGNVIFIEAPIFSKLVYDYLNEDEYVALQWTLAVRPETGKVIRAVVVSERSGGILGGRASVVERESFIIFKKKMVRFG